MVHTQQRWVSIHAGGGLEFIAFNCLDRKQKKAAVKPPLFSIGCCGARVALQVGIELGRACS